MELIKQVEINIDYFLALIKKYHAGHLKDKEIVISINKAIDYSVELRNKKELIEQFIDSLTTSTNVDDDWHSFVDAKKVEELDQIINDENMAKFSAVLISFSICFIAVFRSQIAFFLSNY